MLKFHGVVKAVAEPETRTFTKNGEEQSMTRMRVVSESGPLVEKTLEDGRTVKDRQFKDFYDLEGWGGVGKGMSHVNVGEAVYVSGDLRQSSPVELEDGTTFYPKDTLRVSALDFIGPNKAATKSGVQAAAQTMDQEVGQAVAEMEAF